MKELYACGFNAHNQLNYGPLQPEAPEDLHSLKKIVTGNDIVVKYIGWSTVLAIDGELTLRGPRFSNSTDSSSIGLDAALIFHGEDALAFIGDHRGVLGLLTSGGQIQATSGHKPQQSILDNGLTSELIIRHITIAGNEKVVICGSRRYSDQDELPFQQDFSPVVLEFPTFQALLDWDPNPLKPSFSPLPLPPDLNKSSIVALVSNFTSFTILTASGNVYTWGDPRHSSLGRIPTSCSPASSPHLVDFLGGIPIRKTVSRGWITAALSYDNDLYLWGGRPGEKHRITDLPDLSRGADDEAEVKLVDIDGGVDIVDVGIGDGHVLVLCEDGRVFAAGRGENGQLGIGVMEFVEEWIEVRLDLIEGSKITGVYCGAWSSFLMVTRMR
ncbi:MAG: hypothetical protein M1812_004996 [Candelaria pacifica]|nr:MAG: hypothetical protein M1812_004996 [Candelaria pacifica]